MERGVKGGKKKLKEGKEKKREEEKSEMLKLLSRIRGDRVVGSGRSKRQSWSTQRELCVGIKISGFFQTLRGRGFSPTHFILGLRAIQMA